MADSAFTGVGLGVQSPDMMTKLSNLLTIKSQQQALQGQAAEVASAQQSQRQRANLANFDYEQLQGPDGTIDLNKVGLLQGVAGDQFPEIATKMVQLKQQQTEAKSKVLSLSEQARNGLSDILGPLLSNPSLSDPKDPDKGKQLINEGLVQFGKLYGKEAIPVLEAFGPHLQNAPPERRAAALRMIQMQAQSASQQVATQQPTLVNKGDALTNVNPNAATDAVSNVPLTLAPGQQDTVSTDQLGNLNRILRTPRGDIAATAPLGGPTGGPARFGPGERQSLEAQANANFEAVTANRQAASMAPQQLDQINKALKLSQDVSTGAWAQKRATIESGIGSLIPGFAGMDDASKLQELDKFSERIATDASRVLGVNAKTDAERESIHKQNANIGYTPQAIQAVLQYAKAQTMAMEAKGNAQESWLKQQGNGITKQHEFETAFRQAYDPVVFQLQAADPEGQKEIIAGLTPKEATELKEKRKKLRDLGAID